MTRLISRRRALVEFGIGGAALILAGCDTSARAPAAGGSTLLSVWGDPSADGNLTVGPGAPLIDRTELAQPSKLGPELARIAHLTDAHVLDAQSPARVTFLRRLGPPFNSTFRPQEALTAQVLGGAVRPINDFGPDVVIQGGDLIDNAQANELHQAFSVLRGGRVERASGRGPYFGVQAAWDPDPFYYRPAIDAPVHPRLLADAVAPFESVGLRAPVFSVLGDHDVLVAGVVVPTSVTQQIAVGDRAVWDLPTQLNVGRVSGASAAPDGIAAPAQIDALIDELLSVPGVHVPADSARREVSVEEMLGALRGFGSKDGTGALLDYGFDVGTALRVIVLDLVRRGGGSNGVVQVGQAEWLARELAAAGDRWVIVVSHQPLRSSAGGDALLALMDQHPRMLALMWGHTHKNQITPRKAANGGYWQISTASLVDWPQQARALRVLATEGRGVVLETWMLDHAGDQGVGELSRELAYLDAQGGRPQGFAGGALDRNVRLYRQAARS